MWPGTSRHQTSLELRTQAQLRHLANPDSYRVRRAHVKQEKNTADETSRPGLGRTGVGGGERSRTSIPTRPGASDTEANTEVQAETTPSSWHEAGPLAAITAPDTGLPERPVGSDGDAGFPSSLAGVRKAERRRGPSGNVF